MSYTHTTFAQAKSLLATRLGDASKVHWVDTELGLYIKEALRTWNSIAQFFHDSFTFNLTSSATFYDLGVADNTLLARTLTDQDLVNDIQAALLEPRNDWSSSSTWAGTEQFTMDEVVDALEKARNQFLLETLAIQLYSEINAPSPPITRVVLSDSVIDIRRAAWKDQSNRYRSLDRESSLTYDLYQPLWTTAREEPPTAYSIMTVPSTNISLIPPTLANGRLSLVTVEAGSDLDVTQPSGVALNVPQDFAWVLKFGALRDLLGKDGQARDMQRSAYCHQRWTEGILLAKLATAPMRFEINGLAVTATTLDDLDSYSPAWQHATNALSRNVAVTGLNLIALSPPPLANSSIMVDCVRNAIVPSSDSDYVQIGREHFDVLLDYAEHLAMFKDAGAEFSATQGHFDRMMRLAADHNSRLRANSKYFKSLNDPSRQAKKRNPARSDDNQLLDLADSDPTDEEAA